MKGVCKYCGFVGFGGICDECHDRWLARRTANITAIEAEIGPDRFENHQEFVRRLLRMERAQGLRRGQAGIAP